MIFYLVQRKCCVVDSTASAPKPGIDSFQLELRESELPAGKEVCEWQDVNWTEDELALFAQKIRQLPAGKFIADWVEAGLRAAAAGDDEGADICLQVAGGAFRKDFRNLVIKYLRPQAVA